MSRPDPLLAGRALVPRNAFARTALIVAFAVVAAASVAYLPLSFVAINALTIGLIYGCAATGWALAAGYGGLFSFGFSVSFGLPAYGTLFLYESAGIPPLLGLVIASAVAAVVCLVALVPTLRLRGPYFSLGTLAIAVIVLTMFNNARETTGGADGLLIPTDDEGLLYLNSIDERAYAVWAVVLLVVCIVAARLFVNSSRGAQLTAVRDDEDVARSLGVRRTWTKISVLLLSSVLGGLAGGLLAFSSHVVGTTGLLELIVGLNILMYAAVGGIRSVTGPAVGAVALVALTQVLQNSVGVADAPQLFPIVYALIFVAVLYVAPDGVVPSAGRRLAALGRRLGLEVDGPRASSGWGYARRRNGGSAAGADDASAGDPDLIRELRRRLEEDHGARRPPDDEDGSPLLAVEGLRKRFGAVVAADGVALTLTAGARVGIWGPNGSGKSTLLNLIGGQLRPDEGRIALRGQDLARLTPEQRARRGMLRTFQQARVFEAQNAIENVRVGLVAATSLNLLRRADKERCDELCALALRGTGVPSRTWRDPAGTLSTGQRKRLELARVLVCPQVELLLLDEPTAGLDRKAVPLLVDLLDTIAVELGVATIVVDHDIPFVAAVSDRIVAMQRGVVRGEVESRHTDLERALSGQLELEEIGGAV